MAAVVGAAAAAAAAAVNVLRSVLFQEARRARAATLALVQRVCATVDLDGARIFQ